MMVTPLQYCSKALEQTRSVMLPDSKKVSYFKQFDNIIQQ